MKKNKIYIRGAYAPGNIGDDVLMLSVINIVKKVVPEKFISVGVEHPSLARKYNSNIDWIHIKKPISADVVVFGGGGQFFSFNPPPGVKSSLISKVIKSIKAQENLFTAIERLKVSSCGGLDKIYIPRKLAAFCIGLGPFDNHGKGYQRAVEIINKCDYVSVRDDKSKSYCKMLGNESVSEFTDPTLLSDIWYPNQIKKPYYSDKGYISIVLRDWPHDKNGQDFTKELIKFGNYLINNGEKVRFVSVYKEREEDLIAKNDNIDWLVWDARNYSIVEFMNEFVGNSEVIISSRAHGVLLPASLGVPTIAVAIENKLLKVHDMISDGNIIVKIAEHKAFDEALTCFRKDKEQLRVNLEQEITKNHQKVKDAIDEFTKWLKDNV
ncbi:polysaccharide pyruvyl transferase family protein [Klebsiella quasipneumoniae]|jgi:polysaccharide pyruvyl transferase WcaK-like protein|uniref:polysaccharide pyruvyl transferase family protein n=1 Tax=Klebsiella quasipneumoniae TaxID=1463165 RepID=UPI00103307AC|nr:polysaccharide pyruvyl transferase family protein [Klebsiella quasipneumoniae]